MKLLIIIVLMLSRNQNNIEPNDDLPLILHILIQDSKILLFAVISEEMETL